MIENEQASIGRVSIQQLQENPDIIREKVELKVTEILDKYGYRLALTEFKWVDGNITANISVVPKQSS